MGARFFLLTITYCVGKGKDHKQYEYGSKASIASTARGNLIVGVVSHEQSLHDSHTLPEILRHVEISRGKAVKQAVCDRGYRGKREANGTQIILPGKALKKDTRYQKDKKRKQYRRRAAIEPIIGHLKSDYRMAKTTDFANPLMEEWQKKTQSLDFVIINSPPFEAADLR